MREYLAGLADIAGDHPGVGVGLQVRPAVGEHDRIDIDVDDLRLRIRLLRNFMRVACRRQTGTDIEEQGDPLLDDEVAHHPVQDRPVVQRDLFQFRHDGKTGFRHLAIDAVVVLTVQHHVVYPRGGRLTVVENVAPGLP